MVAVAVVGIVGVLCAKEKVKAAVKQPKALHVEGGKLYDKNGKAVQLRGLSTHGMAWFPQYVSRETFKELHDKWNINAVRLAMYTEEYGGYCSGGNQADLKKMVKKGVKYATEQGMYVIVDWHILSDQNPNKHKKEAKSFFKSMSKAFANQENVIYEICNEPNGSTSWKDIKSYAKAVIPIIRANDPDAIILVGTPTWSQEIDKAAASPLKYDNVMYTLHFYAATHKEELRNKMIKAAKAGLPIFVSEFGICDASGNGALDKTQAKAWIKAMDKYGISYMAWNISNKNESSSIIKSSYQKVSGFTTKNLSESGKWLYKIFNAH